MLPMRKTGVKQTQLQVSENFNAVKIQLNLFVC